MRSFSVLLRLQGRQHQWRHMSTCVHVVYVVCACAPVCVVCVCVWCARAHVCVRVFACVRMCVCMCTLKSSLNKIIQVDFITVTELWDLSGQCHGLHHCASETLHRLHLVLSEDNPIWNCCGWSGRAHRRWGRHMWSRRLWCMGR